MHSETRVVLTKKMKTTNMDVLLFLLKHKKLQVIK